MFASKAPLALHSSREDNLYWPKEISRPVGQLVKFFPTAILQLTCSFNETYTYVVLARH
jgi:hypothetical protein